MHDVLDRATHPMKISGNYSNLIIVGERNSNNLINWLTGCPLKLDQKQDPNLSSYS